MGDATPPPPPPPLPPPPLILGYCTFINHDEADGTTNDVLDDNLSSSNGEATDDDSNFELLIKATNDDDDDDDEYSCIYSDDEAEIELLLEDQEMPTELVLSTAHGYGSCSRSSIANQFYSRKNIVFISLDLETGGEYCGICQLSAVFKDMEGKDIVPAFDSYVKPPNTAIWNPKTTEVHGLHKSNEKIINADSIEVVWPKFVSAAEAAIGNDGKQGIIVAWNGKSCDMEWIYRIMHNNINPMRFPKNCHFFLDPCAILTNYKGCSLSKNKTKLPNLQLSTVYKFVKGIELENAHNSLEDCKAQCDILFDERFRPYWNKPRSVCLIKEIWGSKAQTRAKAAAEPSRAVHEQWQADDNARTWEMPPEKDYGSHNGGGVAGPTLLAAQTCRQHANNTFAEIFVSILTLDFLLETVRQSNKYAYDDFVKPVYRSTTSPSSKRNVHYYKPCKETEDGATHRADRTADDKKWKITLGYLLAWLGIVIVHSAEKNDHSISRHWRETPYGLRTPWIYNTMTRDAFLFLERYLHFADSSQMPGNERRPLFKIQPVLDVLIKNMKLWWRAGQKICIDESMILYKGRAIGFGQYMPAKPIKHGIKVFVLCCAVTGFLLSFEVYTGADNASSNSNWDLINKLICAAGITDALGRILYTGESHKITCVRSL
jgi:Transposase IS4/Exonuclease